ncbi:MAG: hypothetical protein U0930_19900, partial [Pirellulales bacterium]
MIHLFPINRSRDLPLKQALVEALLTIAVLASLTQWSWAQVADIQPRVCKPGETTRLTVSGKELDKSLKVVASTNQVALKVESATAEQAIVQLTVPANTPCGPFALWAANQSSTSEPIVMLVDDLASVARESNNTTRQTAQQISTLASISSASRGAQSDFYRFNVEAGKRVAFEVLCQRLHSPMDPVVRLTTLDGRELTTVDETGSDPDVRFSYKFDQAGDYVLELFDSRYTAGGQYHLRLGDFPLIASAKPNVIQRGQTAKLSFITADGHPAESVELTSNAQSTEATVCVSTKSPNGGVSSAWASVRLTDFPVLDSFDPSGFDPSGFVPVRPTDQQSKPIAIPFVPHSISGCLIRPSATDSFTLTGVKDQTLRFSSFCRSLGSSAVLKMQLFNATSAKVAETPIGKDDQFSFDYKFPDDGQYTLKVADLLHRGGPLFHYAIDIKPVDAFSLAVKGDAKTSTRYLMDAVRGCAAIALTVNRTGYNGAIELALNAESAADPNALSGLKILNPTIPAGAKEAKIYVSVGEGWDVNRLSALRLIGRAKDLPNLTSLVTNLDIQRLQRPFIPYPQSWSDGRIVLSGKPSSDSLFTLESQSAVKLAKYVPEQPVTLTLKRLHADFKAAATLLTEKLPPSWAASIKPDKDNFATTFTRADASNPSANLPNEVELQLYAEHGGAGLLESVRLPIQWYDPIQVNITLPSRIVAGSTVPAQVSLQRAIAAQPVSLTWQSLPAGVQAPEKITIAADQSTASFELKTTPEFLSQAPGGQLRLQALVSSRFVEKDFSFAAQSTEAIVIAAPQSIDVYPASIALDSARSKRQLVVTGIEADTSGRDWTMLAQIVSANPQIAEVRGSIVYPKADGETVLQVRVGNVEKSVPVKVTGSSIALPIQFESEVLVALSKQGCNSGACHGSPSGKGMFRLSLRAFDKQLDELTLIREDFGRRINTVEAEESLLLLKPLMKVS